MEHIDATTTHTPLGLISAFFAFICLYIAENISGWNVPNGVMQVCQCFAWIGAGVGGFLAAWYYLHIIRKNNKTKYHDSN